MTPLVSEPEARAATLERSSRLAVAPAVRAGLVRLVGVGLKAGMELTHAKGMFSAVATTAERAVAVLKRQSVLRAQRADAMALGVSVQMRYGWRHRSEGPACMRLGKHLPHTRDLGSHDDHCRHPLRSRLESCAQEQPRVDLCVNACYSLASSGDVRRGRVPQLCHRNRHCLGAAFVLWPWAS